jgi:hypothetical protein
VIPLLLVIYLLLIAPFNALMIRGGLYNRQSAWLEEFNVPVDWMVSRSEVTENGWERYQQWWIDAIGPKVVD